MGHFEEYLNLIKTYQYTEMNNDDCTVADEFPEY